VLLFTLRAGRPPFDSQLGDRDADAEAILESVAAATDESILALLQQQQRSQWVRLQDNEVSLLRHLLAVEPDQRFRVADAAAALQRMLNGLSATQTGALERMVVAVSGAEAEVRAVRGEVRVGNRQLAKIDQSVQGVEQQVKQVKVGVKAVAAGQATSSLAGPATVPIPDATAIPAPSTTCSRAECAAALQGASEAAALRAHNQQLQAESVQQRGEIEQLRRGQARLAAEVERLNQRLAESSGEARTAKVAPESAAESRSGADDKPNGCGCVIC
jgi:cell division protein FtsB